MANQIEILEAVQQLAQIYGKKLETLEGYYYALEDLPGQALQPAVRQAAKTSTWMPAPAELRKIVQGIPVEPGYTCDPITAEWQLLQDKFYLHGVLEEERVRSLIRQSENMDRPHLAEAIRLRLEHWLSPTFPYSDRVYRETFEEDDVCAQT